MPCHARVSVIVGLFLLLAPASWANVSDSVDFELTSGTLPDAVSTLPIFAGTGIGFQIMYVNFFISGTDDFGTPRTFDLDGQLGLLTPPEFPNHSFVVLAYDVNDPSSFPLPTLVDDVVTLGSVAQFELTLNYELDFGESSAPLTLTLDVLSLGSFEYNGETFDATSITAIGTLEALQGIPTPGTAFALLVTAFIPIRRRRG